PARDQGERRRTAERLGHARQPHVGVDAETCAGLEIGNAGADYPTIVASLDHDDDTGWAIGLRDELGRGVLHRSLGIRRMVEETTGGISSRCRYDHCKECAERDADLECKS